MPAAPPPDSPADSPTDPADDSTDDRASSRAKRVRRVWQIGTPLVGILSGALFVVSAESSEGTDLRPGRYTDLSAIVSSESRDVAGLKNRAASLNDQVQDLTAEVGSKKVDEINAKVRELQGPAGRDPVTGSGVTVTLSDADESVRDDSDIDVNYLLVHQQDIQAVVNALWSGGAEAMTLQKQRVISTTGIKCVGNTVVLHGVPYAPPYEITAIGDLTSLRTSLDSSDYIVGYKTYVKAHNLGYEVSTAVEATMPAYDGSSDLRYAVAGTAATVDRD